MLAVGQLVALHWTGNCGTASEFRMPFIENDDAVKQTPAAGGEAQQLQLTLDTYPTLHNSVPPRTSKTGLIGLDIHVPTRWGYWNERIFGAVAWGTIVWLHRSFLPAKPNPQRLACLELPIGWLLA